MEIEITQQDIDQGVLSENECPITIALKRYFKKPLKVSRMHILLKKRSKIEKYPLPEKAIEFNLKLVYGHHMPPFKMTLNQKIVKELED